MADCTSERRSSRHGAGAVWAAGFAALALLTPGVSHAGRPTQSAPAAGKVTAVRFWSLGEVTRISIEVSSDFKYRSDRLPDPDRLFFDIENARPSIGEKKMHVVPVGDSLLKQIRVAETHPGVTRVVLDLEPHDPPLTYTASQLSNPDRLIVELRLKEQPSPPAGASVSGVKTLSDAPLSDIAPDLQTAPPAAPAEVRTLAAPAVFAKPAPRSFHPSPEPPRAPLPTLTMVSSDPPVLPLMALDDPAIPAPRFPLPTLKSNVPAQQVAPVSSGPVRDALPAKTNSGEPSLTRALGLKLGRVVIDAGHGGHDAGTHGVSGLLEKDVVLDVALRLGTLLRERLGSDVVFTRSDDTYIPLEERTRIANEHKADLFLSIHANSSPFKGVAGVETYYLNFTTSKSSMELAAKENAGSQSTIFDLKDVLAKIAMRDKIDESREFASSVQNSLFALSARNNTALKNRGIKKAPFVVLIGASMPSVLAEIGFLTNPADEALLRKPEHRQKIAEALYKGIANYADSLSHFQVAKRQ
jgi:N-acetylmuramoyl-L-alanine amidase